MLIRDAQRQERLLRQQEELRRRWRGFGAAVLSLLATAGAAIAGFVDQSCERDGHDQHS